MTDTPKPTLAEILREQSRFANDSAARRGECSPARYLDAGASQGLLSAANLAAEHEARWSAERAELELRANVLRQHVEELSAEIEEHEKELEAFRALAKRSVARLHVLREFGQAPADLEIELTKLAPKENAT